MERQFILRDYAGSDPRSAKAMLLGRDDGRGQAWETYVAKHRQANPFVTEEELVDNYPRAVRVKEVRELAEWRAIERDAMETLGWLRSLFWPAVAFTAAALIYVQL